MWSSGDVALLASLCASAGMLGLAGVPHCGAMCAAPCATVMPGGVPLRALLGRALGYAALGAVASGTVGALSRWTQLSAALQPLWVMVLAAVVMLGGHMVLHGRLPGVFERWGLQAYAFVKSNMAHPATHWRGLVRRTLLPVALGAAWAALPCGLIYAAVTVAALAPDALGGALVMAVFSAPGAVALWWLPRRLGGLMGAGRVPALEAAATPAVAPVTWLRPQPSGHPVGAPAPAVATLLSGAPARPRWLWGHAQALDPRRSVRLAGVLLTAAAAWALVQRLTAQWQAWCA